MDWKPTGDTVIVKRVDLAPKERGGILLPQSLSQEIEMGEVVAVGPGSYSSGGTRMDLGLQIGDIVAYNKQVQTQRFIDDDKEYFMVRGIAVLAYRRKAEDA